MSGFSLFSFNLAKQAPSSPLNCEERDKYGHNALHIACIEGDVEAARAALEKGIPVDSPVSDNQYFYSGLTALHIVAYQIHDYKPDVSVNLLRLLFEYNAQLLPTAESTVRLCDQWASSTAFHMVMNATLLKSVYPGVDAMHLLFERFPESLNRANDAGKTPLHILYGSQFLSFIRQRVREDAFAALKPENRYSCCFDNPHLPADVRHQQEKEIARQRLALFLNHWLPQVDLLVADADNRTVLDTAFHIIGNRFNVWPQFEDMPVKYQALFTQVRANVQANKKEALYQWLYEQYDEFYPDVTDLVSEYLFGAEVYDYARQYARDNPVWSLFDKVPEVVEEVSLHPSKKLAC